MFEHSVRSQQAKATTYGLSLCQWTPLQMQQQAEPQRLRQPWRAVAKRAGMAIEDAVRLRTRVAAERSCHQLQGPCGEGDGTASLPGLSLQTLEPQILSCLLTPTLTTTPGLPPLNLDCVSTPNSTADLKWVALLLAVNLLLLPCSLRCSTVLTAAALESCTGEEFDRKVHPH